jgi:hypothetical protein
MAKKQNTEAILEKLNDEIAAGALTQATLDELVKASGTNKNVAATVRGLLEQNVISLKDGKLVASPGEKPFVPDTKGAETRAAAEKEKAELEAARKELEQRKAVESGKAPPPAEAPEPAGTPKPSRKEQLERMDAIKRNARKTPTLEGIEPKSFIEGDPEERIKGLRAKNFKEDWGRSTAEVQNRILRNTFGEKALSLPTATRNKLGELAMAHEAFKQSGLTSLPDMDDDIKRFDTIKDQLKATTVPKGIDTQISNAHSSLITASGGKIRSDKLTFRKPRAGQVGSAKVGETEVAAPKPESPVKQASPGFETAKRVAVPEEARKSQGKRPMDAGPKETAAPAAPAAAEAPAGKRPMDGGPAPSAPAAPTAAAAPAETSKKELTAFQQAVNADPDKYGKGFGAQAARTNKWTTEQRAARKELVARLGLNTPEARAAKKAAEAADDPELAEVKKRYGEAVRSNPTKYGPRSNKKATEAQKAAKKDLFSKLTEQVKAEFAAKTPGPATSAPAASTAPAASAAAAAPAPATAPATAPAAPAPKGTVRDVLGPTATGTPVPAPAPATSGGAPAPKAKAGPWKKGRMQTGLGKGKGVAALRNRLSSITGRGGMGAAGGAMRFLGPLFGAFAAYQLLDLAKRGTVDAADERRLRALEALSAVGQGAQGELAGREQIRQMQRMVDLAAIQRQQQLDQMNQQYTQDMAMNSLIQANQASLAALAQPSRPGMAEMLARYG